MKAIAGLIYALLIVACGAGVMMLGVEWFVK